MSRFFNVQIILNVIIKGVTLYSIGIKDIKVEEIPPSDSRHIQAGYSTR